jgi:RimJ/RimL family protein N-acetyltransferase
VTESFRALTRADIPAFLDLCQELRSQQAGVSFVRIEGEEKIREWLDNPRIYLYGIYDEQTLLGAFKAEQGEQGKEHSCYIAGALTASKRGQGLGKRMLELSLKELESQGIWMVRAWVYSNNHPSLCTLLSAGFTWAGSVVKHQWSPEEHKYIDDLLFHKELPH